MYKYFVRKKSSQALMRDNPEDVARLEATFNEKLSEFGEVIIYDRSEIITSSITLPLQVISKQEKVRDDLLNRFTALTNDRNELFKVQQESIAGIF